MENLVTFEITINSVDKSIKVKNPSNMREDIMISMDTKIQDLFHLLHDNSTYTYVMVDKNTGYYKIGKSKNIIKRENTLQSEKPSIEFILFNTNDVETKMHQYFSKQRIRGEWFKLSSLDIETIHKNFGFIDCKFYNGITQKEKNVNMANMNDELLLKSACILFDAGYGSTSLLQRKLKIGYNRAGRLIDKLEQLGIVGSFEGSKAREVLIENKEDLYNLCL